MEKGLERKVSYDCGKEIMLSQFLELGIINRKMGGAKYRDGIT